MSSAYGRDSIGLHFTFERVPVDAVLRDIEAALAPFDPRPHPGKLHLTPGTYERAEDFEALAARLDPRGAFRVTEPG
jgi:xylitol oxidase